MQPAPTKASPGASTSAPSSAPAASQSTGSRLAQRIQDQAHLRVQTQALVHGAQQLGLGALAHCEANTLCHFLREAFGQQAQLEDATGGVGGVEAFGSGAQLSQQGRVGGQKTEVARAHRARWCPNVNWATA